MDPLELAKSVKPIPVGDPRRDENLARHMEGSVTPPVLYHGTTAPNIESFNVRSRGPKLMDGLGAHFGSVKAAHDRLKQNVGENAENANVMPVHVAIKNPPVKKDGSFMNESELQGFLSRVATNIGIPKSEHRGMAVYGGVKPHVYTKLKDELIRRGHDGLAYINSHEDRGSPSFVAFHPHQIKSAIGNNGHFDPSNPDITKARGGDVEGYATKGAVTKPTQYNQPFGPFQKGKLVSQEKIGPQDRPWERWVPAGYASHDDVPIINPQDLIGKRVGSLLADLTRAGGYYSGIDSSRVDKPEPMLGGPGYPILPESQKHGLAWAVQGKGKGSAKLNKDFDYIAVHAMNPDSHLSNASMSNAVAKTIQAYMRDQRMTPDAVKQLNGLVKGAAQNPKHKQLAKFPGFEHPEIQKFMKNMNFEDRLKMYDVLGQAKAQSLGAPSIEKIRRDTLSPHHAGDPYGSASYLLEVPKGSADSLVNLGESGLPIHPSYDWGIHGRIVGRFAHPVAAETLHQPWFDAKNEENKTKVTPTGKPPNIRRSFEMALPVTTITKEIADKLPHAPKDIQSAKAAQLALNAFNDQWGDTNTKVKEGGVGSADFSRALRNSDSSSTLSQYSEKDINDMKKAGKFTGYKLKDGEVYFGLKHGTDYGDEYGFHHPELTNNETALTSVVNNEPGAKGIGGAPVVLKAIQHGATALDAYAVPTDKHPNGFLPDFYSHFGFHELGRVPFDPKYVTPQQFADMKHEWKKTGWDEDRHGLPSLAIMKWRGSDADRQDAVRRFVTQSSQSDIPGNHPIDVGSAAGPVQQGAGQGAGAPQGQLGNYNASGNRGPVGADNAPRPSDRFTRTLAAIKTLQPHEAQHFGLNPADIEQAKASGLATGGYVRRPYKKGGKVEGSVWHQRDAFDDGGSADPRGAAEARGLGSSSGPDNSSSEQKAPDSSDQKSPDSPDQKDGGNEPSPEQQKGMFNRGDISHMETPNIQQAIQHLAAGETVNASGGDTNLPSLGMRLGTAQDVKEGNAAEAAAAKLESAFGPSVGSTQFGQDPLQSGSFFGGTPSPVTPQHYESTLEQNLVEPAFSQPTPTQPIAPHTPTPDTAYNAAQPPAPFQPDPNAAARQARDTIPQNMGFSPQPQQTIAASQPASIPMTGNVPLPPINPTTITGTGPVADFVQGITGLFGMNAEQQIGRKQTGYADQGMNPYDAYTHAQYDVLGAQRAGAESAAAAGHGGGPQNKMVQKLMPDGTYQWVDEPYKKGGKVYRRTVGSQMTDHVISKFGAPLPASKYQPIGSKAGRR